MAPTVDRALLEDPVRRRLYQLLARRALNWSSGSGSVAVDWASGALHAGWDSMPLAVLACLAKPPNEFETEKWLAGTLRSLGLPQPGRAELLELLALTVAGDVVAGTLSPEAGCLELSQLCSATGYPKPLMPFLSGEDAFDLARRDHRGTVEEAEERVREDARRLVEGAER